MSEEEQLKQDLLNVSGKFFKTSLDCIEIQHNELEELEKENEELKDQIKLFKKDLAKAEETCQKYNSRYYDIKLILSKFEKWLKEQYSISFDPWFPKILNKLQELKGESDKNRS